MTAVLTAQQGFAAAAHVHFTGGAPAFTTQRGFDNTITDNGVGDVTLTLKDAYDFTGGRALIMAQGYLATLGAILSVEPVGASPQTQIRCRLATATAVPAVAAADWDFAIAIIPVGNP